MLAKLPSFLLAPIGQDAKKFKSNRNATKSHATLWHATVITSYLQRSNYSIGLY